LPPRSAGGPDIRTQYKASAPARGEGGLLAAMPLQELRRARQLSQEQLAEELGATQPEISKIERRTDMYVSTLRRFVEAMGGQLEISARFPDGTVQITQFQELDAAKK
jgi:transcriptional regulator with XRE-family HTH domain